MSEAEALKKKNNNSYSAFSIWGAVIGLVLILLGTLRSKDVDGNENFQKSNRFYKQNENFARASHFFVHLFPVFARLRRENA